MDPKLRSQYGYTRDAYEAMLQRASTELDRLSVEIEGDTGRVLWMTARVVGS